MSHDEMPPEGPPHAMPTLKVMSLPKAVAVKSAPPPPNAKSKKTMEPTSKYPPPKKPRPMPPKGPPPTHLRAASEGTDEATATRRDAAAATDEADTTKDGHNAAANEHAAKADAGKLRSATVKALIRKYHATFEYSRAMEVAQMAMEDACVRILMADEAASYEKLQQPRCLSI